MFNRPMLDTVKRYVHYRIQVFYIGTLDDRALQDIGVSRDDLCAEAWQRAGFAAG